MSYSSLPLTSKLFQLTSLTCALALAGCGGGDGTDVIAPTPDLGVQPGTGGNNGGGNNNGGGEQTPVEEDFILPEITINPILIEFSDKKDEPTVFTATVKAVKSASLSAMSGKEVSLKIEPSENSGVLTIEGESTQVTDAKGDAVYELKLHPQSIKDEAALIEKGFTLTATSTKADGTIVQQVRAVPVFKKGGGGNSQVIPSTLKVKSDIKTTSVSSNILNVYGDIATFSVIVEDENQVRAQGVSVGLGLAGADGVSIIEGNNKKTDTNGVASFKIKLEEGLSKEARDALIQGGVIYSVSIKEESGATKQQSFKLPIAPPILDYNLKITGSSNQLSAYGDTQQLTIAATPINDKVPTIIKDAKVSVKLDEVLEGVSLSSEQLILDATGKATVNLIIAPTLSAAAREKLATDGIKYTVILNEPSRASNVKRDKRIVYVPTAKYKINFNESSKKEISSSGGSAVISFRVNDEKGGAVANQLVSVLVPNTLTSKGLLTIDGGAEQTTDDKGVVSYTIRVPAGLTETQKAELETIKIGSLAKGFFVLNAMAIEASGASSSISSQPVKISSDIGQSNIALAPLSTIPNIITPLNKEFTLQLSGKRNDGSAANGRAVKLILDNVQGVTIVGNEQQTNSTGIASFTIRIDPNLNKTQRDALIESGITYTAILTDSDGTQSKISKQKIVIKKPATSIKFGAIINPSISQLGGTGNIEVQLVSIATAPEAIKNKSINIILDATAKTYGIRVAADTQTTDFNGNAIFTMTVPDSLSAEQRAALKAKGIGYELSYIENDITYYEKSKIPAIQITQPIVSFNILNSLNNIDSRPGYILNEMGDKAKIEVQLSNKTSRTQVSDQPIALGFNKKLASLLTVNGQTGSGNITATTNANGIATFDIDLPAGLNPEQRQLLRNEILTATLTETLTGQEQEVNIKIQSMTPTISLTKRQSKPLNLNGGETQIEVIAEDNDGNIVTGQKVFLALPAVIASQGVTLVSGSQTTDNSGKAIFTIAVRNDLTEDQKKAIEGKGNSFAIGLSTIDDNRNIVTQPADVTTVKPDVNGTQEVMSIGANKVINTEGDTFKVFVRLNNPKGGIASRDVTLNLDNPDIKTITIANNTVKTNGDGIATFELKLEKGLAIDQDLLKSGIRVTATTNTAENTSLKQSYNLAVNAVSIDEYKIWVSSDKSTLNTGGDQTNATFRVTDSKGGALANVPVQLRINNPDEVGAALTTPSIVTTDAEGKINAGIILSANTINSRLNSEVKIIAEIITPEFDKDGYVGMNPIPRAENSLILSTVGTQISIEASLSELNPGDSTTITTKLIDGSGRAIAGADMELVDADGNIVANAVKKNPNGTNADGVEEFTLTSAEASVFDNNGNVRVFAVAKGEAGSGQVTQRSIDSVNLVNISQTGISFTDLRLLYNANVSHNIDVQIRTDSIADARNLVGKDIELETTLGTFANGQVTTKVRIQPSDIDSVNSRNINIKAPLTSTFAGTAVLQARVTGEPKYQTTTDIRFRATTPTTMSLQAVRSTIVPNSSTEIIALIKDKNGVPVEGETVVFSRSVETSTGRLSASTAVTNNKGEARVVYQANASTAINGVVINAKLRDNGNINETVKLTVSKEAVYATLAFSNDLQKTSDGIYYTLAGSISVMDGSGHAVAKQDVSLKSYAIEYAQGNVCLLDSKVSYQTADKLERYSEQLALPMKSGWFNTEDPDYNYTLERDDDLNNNNRLDAINPVSIIGSSGVSDDDYTFVTNEEGRADFSIRYPIRYANWVKVRFDASTRLNGSENLQSLNFVLPYLPEDVEIVNGTLKTPWANNASAFGAGGVQCIENMSINIDEPKNRTRVVLTPSQGFAVTINNDGNTFSPSTTSQGFNSFVVDFDQAFSVADSRKPLAKGAEIRVSNSGFSFKSVIRIN